MIGETHADATVVPVVPPSRRKVQQRWTYEPITPVVSLGPPAPLPKRQSKPPLRFGEDIKSLVAILSPQDSSSHSGPGGSGPPSMLPSSGAQGGGNLPNSSGAPPVHASSSWIPQAPSPHPLSNRYSIGDGRRTGRFFIQLTFPGGELPDQPFAVTSSMTVPTLQRALAELMGRNHGVLMFVGPSWAALNHCGLIVALFVPGTSIPCPALEPGSRLRVVAQGTTIGSSSAHSPDGDASFRLAIRSFDEQESLRTSKRARSSSSEGDADSKSDIFSENDHSSPVPPLLPTQIPDDDENGGKREVMTSISVTRRERGLLMATFRREQRLARRAYLHQLQVNFDAEVAEGRAQRGHSIVLFPTEGECLAEAWENYRFDYMIQHDEDQAHMLVSFRLSLRIEPQHPDDYDRVQSLARTTALWEGLRRVYFGEQEPEPPPAQAMAGPDPPLTHDKVAAALHTEIAALEQRAALARLLDRSNQDDGRSALRFHRDEDDTDPPLDPPPSAPTGLAAMITARPSEGSRTTDSSRSPPTDTEGSQSDVSASFLGLPNCVCFPSAQFPPSISQSGAVSGDFSINSHYSSRSSPCAVCIPSPSAVPLTIVRKLGLLSKRVLRRILAAKESIFKYGTFVPRNDRESDSSPEASRWKAGRDLEWLRLEQHGTFDGCER
jgi:hypothetical protein